MFFPISEIYLDPLLVLGVGTIGGFVSGFLGIGCGVIITPFLMELGIPPITAVASQLSHAIGTNLSNFLSYKRRQDVDFHLATYILLGGIIGAILEWYLMKCSPTQSAMFSKFACIYIMTLIILGCIMLLQSIKTILKIRDSMFTQMFCMRKWMLYLPLHTIFRRSRAEMSVLVPIFIGILTGLIVASLGGGSTLFIAPILTYLIGRISPVVQGTSSLTGFFITAIVTFVYAEIGYHCDILFVMILFAGGSIGSWFGVKVSYKIQRSHIGILSSIVVFGMATMLIVRFFGDTGYVYAQEIKFFCNQSLIYKITKEYPIIYTLSCIAFISISALILEKCFYKISKKKQYGNGAS